MILADDSARRTIATELERNLFVEAGAGTGKTTALVGRLIALVRGGSPLSEVVAITFTEAAAAQLRERVREGLERAAVDEEVPGAERERCRAALAEVDAAAIQTMHAFAQQILHRFPLAAQVPMGFEVFDRSSAELAFERRWRSFVAYTFGNDDTIDSVEAQFLRKAAAFGVQLSHLKSLARVLEPEWHRFVAMDLEQLYVLPPLDVSQLLVRLHVVLGLRANCAVETDAYLHHLNDRIEPWALQLEAAVVGGDEILLAAALRDMPQRKQSANSKNWGSCHQPVMEALQSAAECWQEIVSVQRESIVDHLTVMAMRFVRDGVEQRRSIGTLAFQDLLIMARDVVRDDAQVRSQMRRTYSQLFVDEFQDTDGVQVELIQLLTGGTAPEETVSLFTVGDPKQSIYRFRKADPRQYGTVRSTMAEAVVRLGANFRTLPAIVGWINERFDAVLHDHGYDGFHSLDAAREGHHLGSVAVIDVVEPKGTMRSAEMRAAESDDIVQRIQSAQQQQLPIHDDAGGLRALRFSDVAILMPTRVALAPLERALRAHEIPYRVESRSLIWATQEIRDLVNILQAIVDPADSTAVVAALRTPAFGCSDDDLLRHRNSGGVWDYREDDPDVAIGDRVNDRVNESYGSLRAFHVAHWNTSPSMLLEDICDQRYIRETAFARPRQRESWNRVRFLIDQARSWVDGGGAGVAGFVTWAREQIDSDVDALESVVPESDDEAVRIMTVHAAKGLEFPYAAIIGLQSRVNRYQPATVYWHDDPDQMPEVGLGAKALGLRSRRHAELDAFDDDEDARERMRLLYVAATRAKDHLVVSLRRLDDSYSQKSMAGVLAASMGGKDTSVELQTVSSARREMSPPNQSALESVPPAPMPASNESGLSLCGSSSVRRAIQDAHKLASLSPSYLKDRIAEASTVVPHWHAWPEGAGEEARRFGSAVHRALEIVGGDDSNAIDAVAHAAEEFAIEHREADMQRSVRMALESSPLVASRRAGTVAWREVPIFGRIGPVVVEGMADLLYRDDAGYVIVDYKTDEIVSDEERQCLVAYYRWQLITYMELVVQATGDQRMRACLVFCHPQNAEATVVYIERNAQDRQALAAYAERFHTVRPPQT